MTLKAPFTAEQIAGINAGIDAASADFNAKMSVLGDAAQSAFGAAIEKMRAVVQAMREKP
ncbi:hypothetical protein AB0H76_15225 [Nocardia sp. NPDC050712]|uniref:hypothetical protein n=1 Tax=Nocardia sp. NPDC050712 TaxID=3155518 RepID=UPI0033D0BF5C